ncbi:TolC family protein [Desulfosarcina sp.]|uniref:TolC family protein n=1 Tax=Desulfosarcina sp. TaxID=2027861 RepID=UPI0029BE4E17|nr:TolC family protein [Desulfosarcina sp.]MDX2453070.1 TolC family protein [Desulfosarcina sp.]MDX2490809.1 TolC family protein [Desulfosarcina sp.]
MPRTAVLLVLAFALPWAAAFTGCASKDSYRYETIKTQYADMACNLGQSRAADTPPATCAVNSSLTLQDVLDIAQANNPDLLMAVARIARARAILEKSAAPFYPQVNVYTEYLQGDAPSAYLFKTIDQRKLLPGTDFNNPGWFENYESGVSAGINLFNGGRDGLNREMAKTGLTISQLDRDGIENQVLATAIGAYFDVLAAANFTTVAEESVETTRSQLRIMDVRFQAGGALKTDLLSLQVRMAETEEILVQSRNRQHLAKAALAEILGVEPDIPFGLSEAKPRAVDVPDGPLSALDFALDHRPELASVRERLRRSKMALDATRAGYLPQVDFMTRYYADDPEMKYSTDQANWTAALYLNWKIFDGFATKSNRAEALSQLQETMAADRKTLLAVKFDVKRAYLNLNEAQERLKVTTSNVGTAKETFELVKRQYEGGAADITRYLEAELAYNRSRMSETAAYFDREKARAQIARAIGHWTGNRQNGTQEG